MATNATPMADPRRTKRLLAAASAAAMAMTANTVFAQVNNYFSDTGGALSGSVWSTDVEGPYTSAFTTDAGGGIANFNNATTLSGGTIVFAGINVTENITLGTTAGTISNFNNGVITIDVAAGKTADFGTQTWTSSNTAGYTKNGDGTLALAGGGYSGGFTLNAGTVIVRGVNAMGGSATNWLQINGGTIAANATRDLANKYGGGITVSGNFQLGASTGLAAANANLTFNNTVNLTGGVRTITLGGTGVYSFSTVTNGGLIVQSSGDGTEGILSLTNTAGTANYAGNTLIRSGIVRVDSSANTAAALSSAGTGTIFVGDNSVTLTGSQAKLTANASNKTITNTIITGGTTTNVIGSSNTGGTVTYAGNVTMNTALTLLGEGNGLAFSGKSIVTNGHQLSLQTTGTGNLSIGSTLTGNGPVLVSAANSASVVALNGLNPDFTGNITVQAGTLAFGDHKSPGSGRIHMFDGTRLNLNYTPTSGRDYSMSKILIPVGTGTLNFTSTTGRLNRVSAIDLGSNGVGGTLQMTSTGNAPQTLVTGLITIFGDSTFFVGQSPNGTLQQFFNSVGITDNGADYSITKTGTGTLIMGYSLVASSPIPAIAGVSSTYGGNTNVLEGSMRLGKDDALPTGTTVAIAAGARLDMSGSSGFPNVDVLANQTITGLNDIGGGGGTLAGNTTTTDATRTLTLAGNGTYAFSGSIMNKPDTVRDTKNVLGINKTGSGTQTLSGANSYTGATTVSGGTLKIGHVQGLGANLRAVGLSTRNDLNAAATGTTTVLAGATLDLAATIPSENLVLNGHGVGGAGALVNNGPTPVAIEGGIAGLSISNVGAGYTSAPTVSLTGGGGTGATATAYLGLATATLDAPSVLSAFPTVTVNGGGGFGGVVQATASLVTVNVTNGGSNYTNGTHTINVGGNNGTGATAQVTVAGGAVTGITVLTGGSGYTSFTFSFSGLGGSGATAAAGTFEVNGLRIDDAGVGYSTLPTLTIGAGLTGSMTTGVVNTIDITDFGEGYTAAPTVSVVGGGASTIATATALSGTTVNLASDSSVGGSGDINVKASITGAGMLNKVGGGTLTLSGDNTYTGLTKITAGRLQLGASERIVNANNVELAGGTLDTNGFEETASEISLSASSNIDFGDGESLLAFNTAGNFAEGAILTVENFNGRWYNNETEQFGGEATDQFIIGETSVLTSEQLAAIQFINPSGFIGTFGAIQDTDGFVIAAVPEPGSLAVLGIGMMSLLRRRRRSR